jgi:hypothetical protein
VHDAIEGMQAGTVAITVPTGGFAQTIVSFTRAYATPPIVVASPMLESDGWVAVVGTVTATTVKLRVSTKLGGTQSGSLSCNWIAIGTVA